MSSLEQMYQQVILDHAKHPHGRGLVDFPNGDLLQGQSHQVNTTCGDEVTLRVAVAPGAAGIGGTVESVTWEGQGCSISQASASVMTELVTGASLTEAARLDVLFHDLMSSRGRGLGDDDEDTLGDATAFTGVSQYPARIKCALLGWAALKDSLVRSGALVSTD